MAVVNTLIFTVQISAYNLGYINLLFSTSTCVSIGVVVDVVFITLGLAYQFQLYKKEKEKILIDYLEQQKAINQKILETQESERLRISQEMHDDIGLGLTHITLLSESAKQGKNTLEDVGNIAGLARKLVSSLGEIVWSLQPQNNTTDELFNYLRESLHQILEQTSVNYTINFLNEFEVKNIDGKICRNVVLICKETVNNAIKYSGATTIIVEGICKNNTLEFIIKDNGCGFDKTKLFKGNGLKNIDKRTADMNAQLAIESAKGKGTVISFIVKL